MARREHLDETERVLLCGCNDEPCKEQRQASEDGFKCFECSAPCHPYLGEADD